DQAAEQAAVVGDSGQGAEVTLGDPVASETVERPDALARLIETSGLHDGAPTLAELARNLAATGPVPMAELEYLRRLQDLTGFPEHRPLPLMFSIEASGDGTRSAAPELLWAIEEIEQPGNHATLAEQRAR